MKNEMLASLGTVSLLILGGLSAAMAADLPAPSTEQTADLYRPRTELLLLGNITDNDSNFIEGSIRQNITGYIDQGLKVRFDISRSDFDFDVGGVGTNGEDLHARLLAGYSMLFGMVKATTYLGATFRDREISPSTPFVDEGDDFGFFISGELSADFSDGGEAQILAEYETIDNSIYTSGYYVYPLGPVKIGPTVNYLHEDNYARLAGGLRAEVKFNRHVELTATGAYARGGSNDNLDTESSYLEMQLRTQF